MKIASIKLLFISLAFASGARQGHGKNKPGVRNRGGQTGILKLTIGESCSSNGMCASNCCARTNRKYVCSENTPGTTCSSRFVGGTQEDWLDAINAAREDEQVAIGGAGAFTPVEWSPDLANKAQVWANTIAAQCTNGLPVAESNPEDYGVNTIMNVANPGMAVNRWVTNGINAATIPSTASNPFTQLIWSGSKYAGCADATSELSGTKCSAAVCYFGLAGNCAWSRYTSWQNAVLSGRKCSTVCPTGGDCSDEED